MNKQTMRAIRQPAQAGFTLIELIVVIVILGILAATALPRFANLGGSARVASLNAARGALQTTSSMVHGQWLINAAGPFTLEGITVPVTVAAATSAAGYPAVSSNDFATAAGLTVNDYTVTANNTNAIVAATATAPAIPAFGYTVVPASVAGTATAVNCFISYSQPTAPNTTPTISAPPTDAACQ
ncbi:type II secretion system protein [Oxalobacteraceae bacterium]|nr:type II secretion system protein [Oxalobacteraceae bacterium]